MKIKFKLIFIGFIDFIRRILGKRQRKMTQLFISPLTKYTTDTIQSLPYATLSFFVNNSSTPKEVWADKSKATSRGSIVTADSAGIFPPIWLDGTYRATLKRKSTTLSDSPATGVTQTGWPVDDIGINQNFTAFSAWDATFTYDITTNTFVTGSDGLYYQSFQSPNFNKNPTTEDDYWQQIYFLPQWNLNVNYVDNVLVIYNGLLYRSNTTPNINHAPPNASFWDNLTFNGIVDGNLTVSGTAEIDGTLVVNSAVTATGYIGGSLSKTFDAGIVKTAKKQAATSRISTTTLAADPDLSIVTEAAEYYAFKCIVAWDGQGSTTNGIKLRVATSSGTVRSQMVIANTNTSSANADPTNNETRSSGVAFSKLPNSSAAIESIILEGVIQTTNVGTIYLEWAQAASVATNTRVDVGSFLTITKL